MSTATRVPREPVATDIPDKNEFAESMNKLFSGGVTRMAEVQKKAIDVAAQHATEMLEIWKREVRRVPGSPGLFLLELAGTGIERSIEIQRSMVDLYAEQSRAVADLMKERTSYATKSGEGLMKSAQQAVERTVATHRKTLDQTAAQANAAFDAARKQFGADGGPVEVAAQTMQRGVNAMVEAQKELLEVVSR